MNIKKLFLTKTSDRRMSNILFDYHNNQRRKFVCSRFTLTWILASVLLILFLLVINYFLYPSDDPTILVREEPIERRIIPSRLESAVNGENPPGDYVNPGDFEFLRDPVHLCDTINPPNSVEYQRNPELKLLILVESAADHFEERKAIRSTWGSVAKRSQSPVRLGFVLDNDYRFVSDNETIEFFIYQENSQFKDIIQIDFVESFQSLAAKNFLMLKWVAKMCPHAQYFLKTEDDTFVNIRSVADILNKEPYISEDRFIAGHFKSIEPSLKLPLTEIILNLDNILQNDFLPYATSSYLMSIQTAIDLFGAIKEVKPKLFPEDDAFSTGVSAKHIDVPLIHEPSFITNDPPMPPLWDIYREAPQLPDRNFVESGVVGKLLPWDQGNAYNYTSECNWGRVIGRCISVIYGFLQVAFYAGKTLCVVEKKVDGLQRLHRRQFMFGGKTNFTDCSAFLNRNGRSTSVSNTSTLTTAHSIPPDALKQVWDDMTKSISNTMYYFETAINKTGSFRRKKSV